MGEILVGNRMIIISRGKRKPLETRKGSGVWSLIWMLLIIVTLLGADAYMRSITTNYMYRVSDSNMNLEKLVFRKNELTAEIASLRNPRRIERIGLTKLGLKEPDSSMIIGER